MDNTDTCKLMDKKQMDASTVWQWRIMHVKKYSRCPEPFHYSNQIGLDFNVVSKQIKKLDLQLVTNGVILEVCDFAKTVIKSKRHFITNILENNFDLGFKNEQKRIDFTARILHKFKDLIRKPPHDKHEVFTLFDTSSKSECASNSNNGLNMASTEHKTESFLVEMDDTDDSEQEDEFMCSGAQSKKELKDHPPPLFPYCKEIGLNLDIGSKQSLDPGLFTKGAMLELVHFTRVLTASYSRIILDVLEHNFELDLKNRQVKNRVWFKISNLLKRRKQFNTTGRKPTPEFKNESFSFQTKPFKRPRGSALSNMEAPIYQFKEVTKRRQSDLKNKQEKRALLTTNEQVTKRRRTGQSKHMETNTFSHHTNLCTSGKVEGDHYYICALGDSDLDSEEVTDPGNASKLCTGEEQVQTSRNALNKCDMEQEEMITENNYTCPLGEFDLDSDKVTDSGNVGNEDYLQNPKTCSLSFNIPTESESSCLGVCVPFLTSTDVSSNVNPSFSSKPDKKGLCGDEEQKQIQRNAPQEEIVTEHNIWKLRANRVEQILSALNKEFGPFKWSKRYSLKFNIGFGPKQNISVDSLTNSVLLEIAKFALAINSSLQDFIMEILEYNFDLGLQSQNHRNIFTREMMNKVRKLGSCDNAIKFSNRVFELLGPMPSLNIANQNLSSVIPELSSTSRKEKCDAAPVCPPDPHAEIKEAISPKSVDLYPLCKEIGLKLHVNNSQPNKKLEINKLTNGAMTEVTNFAEKLCGTFEQICLDILRHNFDLQSGDSDLTRNILAQITAAMEQRNLSTCVKAYKKGKRKRKGIVTMEKLDCQNNPNLDACSAGPSQAAIIDQNVGSSPDIEHQDELNLKLWKLRATQIQRILSIPHEEHCPLYSYTRCKKLGIDFSVGVKQNLDLKLLTNGIMVELNTFATTLVSARKYFITEILEYNFNLNFRNEQCRTAFAQQTMDKTNAMNSYKRYSTIRNKKLFELPDMTCIEDSTYDKTTYCPKCYQDRNHTFRHDESDTGHMYHPRPHIMTDTVSADANCTAQKPTKYPSSTISKIEETIMDSYPLCKKIGLNLCVDKDQPKHKLDTLVLTREIMMEVASFAKKLCGIKSKIIHTLLEHNFNIGMQSREVDLVQMFRRSTAQKDGGVTWFSEVFAIRPVSHKQPRYVSKVKKAAAMHSNEKRETIQRRKLAMRINEERATLPSHNKSVAKSKTNHGSAGNCYPICTKIGLDLDVTSKLGEKVKMDLKLLTRAVVLEIHEFATKKVGHYYPRTVFDILDCNFDLSSQHYRRWEFSTATAAKIQMMVKQYCEQLDGAYEVFKLPFVMDPKISQRFEENKQNKKSANSSLDIASKSESSCMGISAYSLPTVNTNVNPPFGHQPDKIGLCEVEEQTRTPGNVPHECDMEQEEMETENYYTCPLGESDLDSDEVTDSGNTGNKDHLQNPESCSLSSDIPRESESSCLGISAPFLTSTDISSSLPTVNSSMDPQSANQLDETGLCGDEQLKPTPRSAPNECDMGQEEMETRNNMWKLRANRVEQILSALNKEFSSFYMSKKIGLEFNVAFGPKQNISVVSLTNSVLLEIAKFALAINSSLQDFIMEILEYNFDLGLQSQHHRNIFACEMMNRVRQLRRCDDSVKLSNRVFELLGPMSSLNIANQSLGSVIPELSSTSRKEKCDAAPVCPLDPHAEIKEAISPKSVDLYPLCKEIGLKLHVNNSQPNKKLEINKLTNGAMTEMTNFAEKLCGTFEQICFDILRHNFDLQSGDSDLTRNILARIPAVMEQKNLLSCVKTHKKRKRTRNYISPVVKQDCQNNPNLDACCAGSSQAAISDQNEGSSADIEHQDELNLKLWKLRANHIQRILSIPHEEHCPLYSYSRCKKLGIDFNVGSEVKQNLDPKLLTNGIIVELSTFATALVSAGKYFVTDILEYNFNLNFKNELYRTAFAQQTMDKIRKMKMYNSQRNKRLFELPDMTCIQEPTYDKTTYCPKCYQDRNHKLRHDESDTGHMNHPRPHIMTDTVSADANCTAQKPTKYPSSTISKMEETIMDSYPLCKKIGLNLCVDKDQPKDKLDTHVLTPAIINEVANFAKKLCGTKIKIIHTLLEYNFNMDMQSQDVDLIEMFRRSTAQNARAQKDNGFAWFDEVFVFHPFSRRRPAHARQLKQASVMQRSKWKETVQKRKLALQTKEERVTLPSHNINVIKSKTNHGSAGKCYPICTKIGLDLDVTSKSGEKEKLDLKLLTTAVVLEIHKFATQKVGHYFPGTVFDILDYNFDLSSQHYRRWEFSLATASKVQTLVKRYRTKRDGADEVFKLPFVFPPKTKQRYLEKRQKKKCKTYSLEEPAKKRNEGSCVHQVRYYLDVNRVIFLGVVKINEEPWSHDEDKKSPTDPWTNNVQMNESLVSVDCGSPLQGNMQIKQEEYDPCYGDMKPEPDTEEKYHPHYDDVKTESNTGDVEYSVPGEPAGSLGYTLTTMCPNSDCNIKIESENEGVQCYILAEPQGSEGHTMLAVWPNTGSYIKTELDTAGVNYLVPVEVAASQGCSTITIGQANESTLIKEERGNMPSDSHHYGVVSYTDSELDIKQERDP